MSKHVLGLITARGGSKGIPQKNIRKVAGKPLIAWTIEAAINSKLDRVVVSTDDQEIAEVSRSWGAEVPFMRPKELAQDDSPHMDVIYHAIQWLSEHEDYHPEYILLVQPTTPLRITKDIDGAINMVIEKVADSVVSVSKSPIHPYLTKRINVDGRLEDFVSKPKGYLRRQDLPPAYALNGAIYLAHREVLLQKETWYTDCTYAYIMPPERSLDIDTPWDLQLADLILRDKERHKSD